MGDEVGDLWEGCRPVHMVTISGFRISEAEITNAQYCAWLNAAIVSGDITVTDAIVTGKKGLYSGQNYIYLSDALYADNRCWIRYNDNGFNVVIGHENWPVVSVTWYGAKAFAEYNGLDLPREAEWEYGCRGGKQYKYGTLDGTISKDKANYSQSGIDHPVDVKSFPKNPFGLFDMSGNVSEWCADWYGTYSPGSAIDPTGTSTGSSRVFRGGSWGNFDDFCRSAGRSYNDPDYRSVSTGFRVVLR
jgi:formylglycine-generating enzyme required for sulfatase activity